MTVQHETGGIGILATIQLVFLILKLGDVVSWSWLAVLVPVILWFLWVCAIRPIVGGFVDYRAEQERLRNFVKKLDQQDQEDRR